MMTTGWQESPHTYYHKTHTWLLLTSTVVTAHHTCAQESHKLPKHKMPACSGNLVSISPCLFNFNSWTIFKTLSSTFEAGLTLSNTSRHVTELVTVKYSHISSNTLYTPAKNVNCSHKSPSSVPPPPQIITLIKVSLIKVWRDTDPRPAHYQPLTKYLFWSGPSETAAGRPASSCSMFSLLTTPSELYKHKN
jgi:hypothetical protein